MKQVFLDIYFRLSTFNHSQHGICRSTVNVTWKNRQKVKSGRLVRNKFPTLASPEPTGSLSFILGEGSNHHSPQGTTDVRCTTPASSETLGSRCCLCCYILLPSDFAEGMTVTTRKMFWPLIPMTSHTVPIRMRNT